MNEEEILKQLYEIRILIQQDVDSNSLRDMSFWLKNVISPVMGASFAFLLILGGRKILFFILAEIRVIMNKCFSLCHSIPYETNGEVIERTRYLEHELDTV